MKTSLKIFICALILLLGAVAGKKIILPYVREHRNFLPGKFWKWAAHRHNTNITDLQPLETNGNEWYAKYHFIAHNGGGIDGKTGTDSREAWELSYKRGVRIIDADLRFTTDDKLVVRHEWFGGYEDLEQDYGMRPLSYQEFKSSLINYKYHPMDVEDMINFMLSHRDLYAAVDTKADRRHDPVSIYSTLVDTAKRMNAEEVLSRIIVSLYSTKDIDRVKAVYPFRNFALRQYGWTHNWYELAEFCVKNDIHAVNIFDFVIDADPEGVKILTSKGIHIFAAVVNSLSQLQAYKDLGVTGAVSDYLSESDWGLLR